MYRSNIWYVQAERTNNSTIYHTKNQIEKFGDHIFEHGAMVIFGELNYDPKYHAVKLTSFTGTLTNFKSNTVTGGTSGVVADVVGTVATDGTTDPDTFL